MSIKWNIVMIFLIIFFMILGFVAGNRSIFELVGWGVALASYVEMLLTKYENGEDK